MIDVRAFQAELVGQKPFAEMEPDALDEVQFGCVGRQRRQGNVAGHLEVARAVPSRLIQHESFRPRPAGPHRR